MKPILFLTSFVLVGCVPRYLVPYDYSIAENNYQAYIETDSVSITVESLSVKGDHYVFGLEVQNYSSTPLFIDTEKMRKHASNLSYRDTTIHMLYQESMKAMTPREVNRMFKAKADGAKAAGFALFLIGAAVSSYAEIKASEDAKKEYWTEKDTKKALTRELTTAVSLATVEVLSEVALSSEQSARTELRHLPNELFDTQVIAPSESYYGKVLFRKPGELYTFHRLALPIDGSSYLFDFRKSTAKERRFLFEQSTRR